MHCISKSFGLNSLHGVMASCRCHTRFHEFGIMLFFIVVITWCDVGTVEAKEHGQGDVCTVK